MSIFFYKCFFQTSSLQCVYVVCILSFILFKLWLSVNPSLSCVLLFFSVSSVFVLHSDAEERWERESEWMKEWQRWETETVTSWSELLTGLATAASLHFTQNSGKSRRTATALVLNTHSSVLTAQQHVVTHSSWGQKWETHTHGSSYDKRV